MFGNIPFAKNTDEISELDKVYQLVLEVTKKDLKGSWKSSSLSPYTYLVYEKNHIIKPQLFGKYSRHNILFRKKFDSDNNLIDDI